MSGPPINMLVMYHTDTCKNSTFQNLSLEWDFNFYSFLFEQEFPRTSNAHTFFGFPAIKIFSSFSQPFML